MADLYEEKTRAEIQELVSQIRRIENQEMRDRLADFGLDYFNTIKSGESFGSTANPATPVSTVGYKPSDPIVPPGSENPMEHVHEALRPVAPTSPPSPVVAQPAEVQTSPLGAPVSSVPPEQSGTGEPAPAEEPQPVVESAPVMPKVVPVVESARVVHPAKGDSSKK